MRVEVLYFAVLRERVRRDQETLELSPGALVREARTAIAARHPEIAALLSRVQTAVNRAVVGEAYVLCEGDELALLPPVAGGSSR